MLKSVSSSPHISHNPFPPPLLLVSLSPLLTRSCLMIIFFHLWRGFGLCSYCIILFRAGPQSLVGRWWCKMIINVGNKFNLILVVCAARETLLLDHVPWLGSAGLYSVFTIFLLLFFLRHHPQVENSIRFGVNGFYWVMDVEWWVLWDRLERGGGGEKEGWVKIIDPG